MDIATRTLMVTLPVADAGFLKKQAKCMGWTIDNIPPDCKRTDSAVKRRTLKAISDVRQGKGVTHCSSFEEYLKAVSDQ